MSKFNIHTRVVTDKTGYGFLAKLYHEISTSDVDSHIIDFSGCNYFDANLAAALGAILDNLKLVGHSFTLSMPRKSNIVRTLARNGFLKIWSPAIDSKEKENFIRYQKFPSDSAIQFKQYIDDWLMKKQKFPAHTNLAGDKIQESIYEIYANAVSHGKTKHVYSCGEYNTENHTLDMTVVDCGKTIPSNVNDFFSSTGREAISSTESLKWALKRGNTTKSMPGGLGLAILTEFIALNEGCLQMVSGDAFLEYKNGITIVDNLDCIFPGTIVNMKFNFDDNKKYRMITEREDNKIDKKDLL